MGLQRVQNSHIYNFNMSINIIVSKNCIEVCLFPLFTFIQENLSASPNGLRFLGKSNGVDLNFIIHP